MFRSMRSKAALAFAGGALALTMAAAPAQALTSASSAAPQASTSRQDVADVEATDLYKGEVIARIGLNVRNKPWGRVIGALPKGEKVKIVCKVNAQPAVDGNPRWYKILFHHGTGWVAARYVKNIGPAPRFCH